jgi:hypothetical protein
MISKTVVVLGEKQVLIRPFIESGSGVPVIGLADFGRDISGEDLKSIDTTIYDEVQIIVGSMDAAKSLHGAISAILKLYEDSAQ